MKIYPYTKVPAEPMQDRPGVAIRWAIGKNVGAPHFIMRVIEIAPGASTEHHAHKWEHEVFVLEGMGTVYDAQGETSVGPGTCIYIAPDEVHQFTNKGDSLLRIICVIPKLPEN